MNGQQLRAARALLNWSAQALAEASKVSLATIRRAESGDGETSLTAANLHALQQTLEAAGVEFIPADGSGGAGVRVKHSAATAQAAGNE